MVIYKMHNLPGQIIVEYRKKNISMELSNISLEVEESSRKQFIMGIRIKNMTQFMIEIFETRQTKSIAKMRNKVYVQ